jgi:hypothetical protein
MSEEKDTSSPSLDLWNRSFCGRAPGTCRRGTNPQTYFETETLHAAHPCTTQTEEPVEQLLKPELRKPICFPAFFEQPVVQIIGQKKATNNQ